MCPPPPDRARSPVIDVSEHAGVRQVSSANRIIKIDSVSPTQIDGRML